MLFGEDDDTKLKEGEVNDGDDDYDSEEDDESDESD
jgi:hypothetical protein